MPAIRTAVLVFGLGLSGHVLAGSVLELETAEYYEDPPVVSTVRISADDGSMRMEVSSLDDQATGGLIYRGDRREMVGIDHTKREYYVLDEASMQQMATQMESAMQDMQKALEDMPPEQRAMAEQMMKQHMPQSMQQPAEAPATVHATGEEDSINGFNCDHYEVRRHDRKVRELCVTPWDDLPEGQALAGAMREMADFFDRMAKAFSEGGMNLLGEQQEIFAHMKELDGYPVLTREFDDTGEVASESVLASASAEDVAPALFNPPPDYRKMQLGM